MDSLQPQKQDFFITVRIWLAQRNENEDKEKARNHSIVWIAGYHFQIFLNLIPRVVLKKGENKDIRDIERGTDWKNDVEDSCHEVVGDRRGKSKRSPFIKLRQLEELDTLQLLLQARQPTVEDLPQREEEHGALVTFPEVVQLKLGQLIQFRQGLHNSIFKNVPDLSHRTVQSVIISISSFY